MRRRVILSLGLLGLACGLGAQPARFVFWNVENYYDPFVDSVQQDMAFTPQGANHWTWRRFLAKRDAIAKTLIAVGEGDFPVWVGLCEVESRFALEQLVRETPLAKGEYRVLHHDGPDARGIDVALLYRPQRFRPLNLKFLRVAFADTTRHTREILYVKGVLDGLDTLHIWVNHWPSKLGGAKASLPRRFAAARRLKASVDSVFALHPQANIIITGDFNDTPRAKPLVQGLGAIPLPKTREPPQPLPSQSLFNLAAPLAAERAGTIRFRGKWELIDQCMVSSNLLRTDEPVSISPAGFCIFKAPFLLTTERTFLGEKPFRTYLGPRYQGGISDHLPVLWDVMRNY
jgi:Predicted extracellular nuclease